MAESPAPMEVVEEVHHTELHQHIINLPTAQFLGLADVGVELP